MLARQIAAGEFRPIYYLMGDEPYFINKLADLIVEKALAEEERDFNLITLYGADVNGADVVNAARRYPMMAERQVVVVREAQSISEGLDAMAIYAQKPLASTILVICHPHGRIDRRTKLATEVSRAGIIFESNKIYESQLPGFVSTYVQNKGLEIEPNANQLLCEYVGADLSRLTGELDKLVIAIDAANAHTGQGSAPRRIDAQLIQDHIGISKDYNVFELTDALGTKNILKANKIVKYFNSNPKGFAIQPVLASLFTYYANLLQAFYSPVRTEEGIAAWLGQTSWQVRKNVMPAMRHYTAMKVFNIIGQIRQTDAASKGVGGQKTSDADLLKELIFYILH